MKKYLYLTLLGASLSLTMFADENADKQKNIEDKVSTLTKDKDIFFSETAYFQDKTEKTRKAHFSEKEAFTNHIVSLHHPFCTKDLAHRHNFIANFELKNKPTDKQIDAIVKHFNTPHGSLSPVIYFEIEKLEVSNHNGRTEGQVKIIGYGLLDRKKMREGTASNADVVTNTYFTKETFIPLSDE